MSFNEYRNTKGYSTSSKKVQDSHIYGFKKWCLLHHIDVVSINYKQVLQFIDSERQRGLANASIVRTINSIRIYYDYLQESGIVQHNIIASIKIRSNAKKVLVEALNTQQLEAIYQDFLQLPHWKLKTKIAEKLHPRNSVVLGLLVYQGITTGEISKLEVSHIQLSKGKIYIPATRKSNARILQLAANQILPLQNYLSSKSLKYRLFPTKKSSDMVCSILNQVKNIHPKIRDSRQIRASVIMNWLELYPIREVQYKAGHKSIKSTERYRREDLRDLTRQLEAYHPLE